DAADILFERLEPRAMFSAGAMDVRIGTGAARSVRFLDADGSAVSISMSGAAAIVHLTGDGLVQSREGGGTVVSGTAVTVSGGAAGATLPHPPARPHPSPALAPGGTSRRSRRRHLRPRQ